MMRSVVLSAVFVQRSSTKENLSVKRILLPCALLLLAACGDDDEPFRYNRMGDAGLDGSVAHHAGVCDLDKCPTPEMGAACCSPQGQCGFDPIGLGLNCAPNPGEPTGKVCDLAMCPEPTTGVACCTPYGECGFDPFRSGLICFGFPESSNEDAGPPTCDLAKCPRSDGGPRACCLDDGGCGFDELDIGLCVAPDGDAGADAGAPMSGPPDDPSITGECPSFIDFDGNPMWGCCSQYALCGTFAFDACLLPVGTEIPSTGGQVSSDEDAGAGAPMHCTPPATVE
jgi:hypothetical protein